MAGVAFNRAVCADQGKAVLMTAHRLQRNPPPSYRVAPFALGSKLLPMNVGMTITAFGPDVGKYQVDVALRTGDAFV